MSKLRSRSNPPPRSSTVIKGPSKTQQNFEADSNINNMVKKHLSGPNRLAGLQAMGNPMATRRLTFGEVPSESYHEMLNKVTDVQNLFRTLPSRIRGRFNNNPYQLLRWVEVPQNRDEAIKMGLIFDPEHLEHLADKEAREAAEAAGQQSLLKGGDITGQGAQPPQNPPQGGAKA